MFSVLEICAQEQEDLADSNLRAKDMEPLISRGIFSALEICAQEQEDLTGSYLRAKDTEPYHAGYSQYY